MEVFKKRMDFIQIRVSEFEKNRIKGLANLYAEGDVSAWLRWAGMNADRKFIKKRGSKKTPQKRKQEFFD